MKKFVDTALMIISGFFLSFAALSLAIFIALQATFLYPHLASDIDNRRGLSQETIRWNYRNLIDYNVNPFKDKLDFKDLPMSDEGRTHFEEVKDIFQAFFKWGLLSVPVLIICKKIYGRKKWRSAVTLGLFISLGALLVLIPIFFFAFDRAFVIFHKIFFNNDFWIFSYQKDPIIFYLPQSFFEKMALLIISLWFLVLVILRLLAGLRRARSRRGRLP